VNKTKITVKTELEIILPTVPNFVRMANKDVVMPISKLTREQIKELGECWTQALLDKSAKKKGDEIRAINKKLGNL